MANIDPKSFPNEPELTRNEKEQIETAVYFDDFDSVPLNRNAQRYARAVNSRKLRQLSLVQTFGVK